MFIETILNEFNMTLILDKYDKEYLESLNPYKFANIYNIFINNKFYFIEDLVINYLEIFSLDEEIILDAIDSIKNKYGDNYIYYLGKDLSILDNAINEEIEKL